MVNGGWWMVNGGCIGVSLLCHLERAERVERSVKIIHDSLTTIHF